VIPVTFALALCAVSIFAALFFIVISGEDFGLPAEAKERARKLFFSRLDASQRRSWLFRRRFEVTGSTGRRYTIKPYGTFNIRSGVELFCLRVEGHMPSYDKLLAQRLLLEADEHLFLAIANRRQR